MIDAGVLEEDCHREVLVVGALKVGRETATREATCDLGCIVLYLVLRAADTSTQGPAKVQRSNERLVPVPVYSLQGEIEHHTHRMRGRWV